MTDIDKIKQEIDRRKLAILDLPSDTPTVFVCDCGLINDIANIQCIECGRLL